MDYQKVEVKTFEEFGNSGCMVYFLHTEHYTLISIPEWNWSFLWNLIGTDDRIVKKECIKALSVPMFSRDAEALTERIYSYLLWD